MYYLFEFALLKLIRNCIIHEIVTSYCLMFRMNFTYLTHYFKSVTVIFSHYIS